jgi:hypothetical protein
MKFFITIILTVLGILLINPIAQAIEPGEVPPKVVLKEKLGGRLDGKPWSSEELQGKVHVLFYVDPDEKDTNNHVSEALNNEKFPDEKIHYFGIINMAATWMPNFAINMALKEKQERYPKTTYLRDNKKVLVQSWKIADDRSDVLAFDKKGKLFFIKEGKLTAAEVQRLIKAVRDNL